MATRVKIDWVEAFKWLEMGYLTGDLARMHGICQDSLCRRARNELSEDEHKRWKALNAKNRMRIRWEGHQRVPCGTPGGNTRHRREGTPPCDACRAAHAKDCKDRRERKKREATSK